MLAMRPTVGNISRPSGSPTTASKSRRLALVTAALLSVGISLPTASPAALQKPGSNYAAIVVDHDSGKVLFNEAALARRHPASLTKMMTLYLTFEALEDGRLTLNGQIPVSAHAASMEPSKLGIPAGGHLSVEDAILAIVTKSANDIAVVLAEALAPSEAAFAEVMNRKALELGMTGTNFQNASGLPGSDHYSTARDLVILSRALVSRYPAPYRWFSTEGFRHGNLIYPNMNSFLRTYAGADGIKTGYTNAAGHCLSGSAVRNGRRVFVVVLGGPSMAWTRKQVTALTDISFGNDSRDFADLRLRPVRPASTAIASAAKTAPAAGPPPAPAKAAPQIASISAAKPTTPRAQGSRSARLPVAAGTPAAQQKATKKAPSDSGSAQAPARPPQAVARAASPAEPTQPALAHAAGVTSLRGFDSGEITLPANTAPVEIAGTGPRPAPGHWSIRVGEFGDMVAANRRAQHVIELLPQPLGGARLQLESQDNSIDVKLVSLTETDARQVCGALQQARMPCIVVPPGRKVFITRR